MVGWVYPNRSHRTSSGDPVFHGIQRVQPSTLMKHLIGCCITNRDSGGP